MSLITATLLVIDELFGAKKDSPEGTLLEVLSALVERYVRMAPSNRSWKTEG